MSRPYKHPKTGVYWLRLDVPRDLQHLVGRKELRRSLGTKDPVEAKSVISERLTAIHREWGRLRALPEPLTRQQVVALGGEVYRTYAELGGRTPGSDASVWREVAGAAQRVGSQSTEDVLTFFDADGRLAAAGLPRVEDVASREALAAELLRGMERAASVNVRKADGNFSPFPYAVQYSEKALVASPAGPAVSLSSLLDLWRKEHAAAGGAAKTAGAWPRFIERFIAHLGHEDALRVRPCSQRWSPFRGHFRGVAKLAR